MGHYSSLSSTLFATALLKHTLVASIAIKLFQSCKYFDKRKRTAISAVPDFFYDIFALVSVLMTGF